MTQNTNPSTLQDHLYQDTLVGPYLKTALEDTKERIQRAMDQIAEAEKDACAIIRVMRMLGEDPGDPSDESSDEPLADPEEQPSTLGSMTLEQATLLATDQDRTIMFFLQARDEGRLHCPRCRRVLSMDLDDCDGGYIDYPAYSVKPGNFHCNPCNHTFSLKNGTPMHGSKVTLGKWLLAVYLMKVHPQKYSKTQLADGISVNINTAAQMYSTIEKVCTDPANPLRDVASLTPLPDSPPEGPGEAPGNDDGGPNLPQRPPGDTNPAGASAAPGPEQSPANEQQEHSEGKATDAPETEQSPADEQQEHSQGKATDAPETEQSPADEQQEHSQGGAADAPETEEPPASDQRDDAADPAPEESGPSAQAAVTGNSAKSRKPFRQEPPDLPPTTNNSPRGMNATKTPCPKCGATGINNDDELGPRCIMCTRPVSLPGDQAYNTEDNQADDKPYNQPCDQLYKQPYDMAEPLVLAAAG